MSFEFNKRKSHCSVLCVTLCWCSSSPENFNVIMEEKVNSNPLWRDFSQKQVSWSWGENKLFDAEQDRREYCLKKNWKYFQTSFCLSVCLVCLLWDIKSITSSSTRQKHDYRSSFTNIQCLNKILIFHFLCQSQKFLLKWVVDDWDVSISRWLWEHLVLELHKSVFCHKIR